MGIVKAEDEPQDLLGLDTYLDAFRELGTCRSNSMGLGPIPFTAIVEYSRLYDVGDFEEFNYIIRRMDNALLDSDSKKQAAKTKSKPEKTDAPGNAKKGNNDIGKDGRRRPDQKTGTGNRGN